MAIARPNLTEAQPGAPITAGDWNAMIQALKTLRATLQELKTRTRTGILVTVRDRDTRDILPPAAVHAVYAVSVASNTLMQPGQRAAGDDQAYLIPIDAAGDYEVTIEPSPGSGYEQQVQRVTVGGTIALLDFMLWEQPRQPVVPMVFGKTLREARAILDTEGVPVQRMLDAHGELIDAETWDAQYGSRLVLGTEPGAGMALAGDDVVDILVAGRIEPVERRPVLVGQIAVTRPTTLALSPDGSLLYVLSQGSARGGSTSITVIDTRRRRVAATIDTGSTPLLNLVFHPQLALAFASVILPEFRIGDLVSQTPVTKLGREIGLPLAGEMPIDFGVLSTEVQPPSRRVSASAPASRAAVGVDTASGVASAGSSVFSAAGLTASPKMALASEALSGRGSALNQLVTDLGSSAAFSSGVANLAALNLAAQLGQAVNARGDQGAIVTIDTAKHQVIPGALISTNKAICYSLDITTDGRTLFATAPTQHIAGWVSLPSRDFQTIMLSERASPAFVRTFGRPSSLVDTVYMTDVTRHVLMRLVNGTVNKEFSAGTSPLGFVVTPQADRAYIINSNLQRGSLVVVNLEGEGPASLVQGLSPRVVSQDGFLLSGIDITPDGSRICVTVEEGLAILRDGSQTFETVKLGGAPAGVVVEPLGADGTGGKYAYVANFGDNLVQIVDLTGEDEPFVRTGFTGQLFPGRLAELMTVPGINEHVAERLVLSGIQSVQELAGADSKLISSALTVNDSQAKTLIGRAGRITLTEK